MVIIGITGTLGAGKGTIVDYLINTKGYAHYSVRSYLLDEIVQRKLAENRDSMVLVANELRKNNSPSFIVDQLYAQASEQKSNAIIESIRTPGEVESLRRKGSFYLFAVDANARTRFDRIKIRASETDRVDFNTFMENEAREMTSDDPNKQNLKRCIELADFRFMNDGNMDQLFQSVEQALESIS